MITQPDKSLVRVTLTLEPGFVDVIDRLAKLEGKNRSEEVRLLGRALLPSLTATVKAFEAAAKQRDNLDREAALVAAAEFDVLAEEAAHLEREMLGSVSRLEGARAASGARDPRRSNHGGHTPTPPDTKAPRK